MAVDLTTTYLGFELRNPVIVGACSLTLNGEAVRKCVDAGAAAVVLKSLFEEQIGGETAALGGALESQLQWHAEAFEYMEADIGMRYGTRDYLQVIRDCKAAVDVPVIASINCVSDEWWQDFVQETTAAGADALELNIAVMPHDATQSAEEIEDTYVRIVKAARKAVDVPIAVKLGPHFTNLPQLVTRLQSAGASAFALFNRFYRPTIDIDNLRVVAGDRYSSPAELTLPLRWISLLSGRTAAEFAATTGAHSGADVVRLLLAGADCVQVVSVLYEHGLGALGQILDELAQWMEQKGMASIADFKGRLSQAQNPDNELFGRLQYIKGLVGIE